MQVLEKYIRSNKLQHNLVVIGDSLKDMELAQREHARGYFYRHPGLDLKDELPSNILLTHDLRDVLAELK